MIENIKNELLEKTALEAGTITLTYSVDDIELKEIGNFINIYINKDFYEQHKDEINKMLIEYIRNYKSESISITTGILITDEIINALCENDNIKTISLAKYNFVSKYSLSKSHFDLFKKANKENIKTSFVDEELKDVDDPIIELNYDKKMFSYYKYRDFQADKIRFYSAIPENDLETLKYLGDNTEITISTSCNIKDIIETLRKFNKNNKVIIEVFDNKKLTEEMTMLGCFKSDYDLEENNIVINPISISGKSISLNEYIEYERLLYSIADQAKDLSPYEKLIYAYDITKKFKRYKTPKKDNKNANDLPREEKARLRGMSRDLYAILDNDYIVCVGFVNLLSDLLTKMGIDNIGQSVEIDIARHKSIKQLLAITPNWKELSPQEKNELIARQTSFIPKTDYEGHRRIMVRLKDEKYGIDGLYFSDPTWDNDLERNTYAHMTMTEADISDSMSTVKVNSNFILFSATSIDEFYQMINTILDKRKNERTKRYEEDKKNGKEITKEKINYDDVADIQQLLLNFFKKIKEIFPNEYKELTTKYPSISEDKLDINNPYDLPEELLNFIYEIAKLVSSKNNNKISDETLKKAISEVYKDVYVGGLKQEELNKMMEDTNLFRSVEFAPRK